MIYAKIRNHSGYKINLKPIFDKVKPYLKLVDKSHFPISITIVKKKYKEDRSAFNLENGEMIMKYNPKLQSEEDFLWAVAHELGHFITFYNKELYKTCFGKEYTLMVELFKKLLDLSDEQVNEVVHDMLPPEVIANFFATLIIRKFYKRHSFQKAEAIIRSKIK